jgi:hypothetical protein
MIFSYEHALQVAVPRRRTGTRASVLAETDLGESRYLPVRLGHQDVAFTARDNLPQALLQAGHLLAPHRPKAAKTSGNPLGVELVELQIQSAQSREV